MGGRQGRRKREGEQAKRPSEQERRASEAKRVVARYVVSTDAALVLLSAASGLLGSVLYSDHREVGIELIVISIIAGAFTVYVTYRYHAQEHQSFQWRPFAVGSVVVVGLLMRSGWAWWNDAPPVLDPFKTQLRVLLADQGRPLIATWMAADRGSPKDLTPIHLAAYMTVTNAQLVRATIDWYLVESGHTAHGPWTKLTHISNAPDGGYRFINTWVGSFDGAFEIDLIDSLDAALSSAPLEAHDTRKGWATWQCRTSDCPGEFLRVTVRDDAGVQGSTILPTDMSDHEHDTARLGHQMYKVVDPNPDMTNATPRFLPYRTEGGRYTTDGTNAR